MSHIEKLLKNKAKPNGSKFLVAAVAVSKRGNVIATRCNTPSRNRYFPLHHAEFNLMCKYGRKISVIYIARFNKRGERLPIKACDMCQGLADRLGIKIEEL